MAETAPKLLVQQRWFWLGVLVVAGTLVAYETQRGGRKPPAPEADFNPKRYMPMPVAPTTEVAVTPAPAIQDELQDDELVLGVVVGEEARAYPINRMNAEPRYKVLNDTLGGQPLAVTWCDKCRTGIVFDRRVDGEALVLGVFGQLWRESMVMYSVHGEQITQWSQWEGKAKAGPLAGRELKRVPALVVDWRSWRAEYPHGTVAVLPPAPREFTTATYLPARDFVLVALDGTALKAWPLDEVKAQGVIQDQLGARPIVALFLPNSGTARAFWRSIQGQICTWRWQNGRCLDEETGSVWDVLTGVAVSGPRAGQRLEPVPSMVTARTTWKLFDR